MRERGCSVSRRRGLAKAFEHADDCKILKADPGVEIEWSEIETGYWVTQRMCGKEYHRDPSPTGVFGSTPMTRPPSATRASANTATRSIPLCSGPS
jgi:hypothetical protein